LNQASIHLHEELVMRCQQGDPVAFQSLYSLYSKAMYNVSYRITGREEDAEDVLQESFVSVFKNLRQYKGDSTFGAWLKRIVVNRSINVIRMRKMELLPEDETFDIKEDEPDEIYRAELTVERVREAIMALPDGYRSVLSLYLLEGYDHQEIAAILGISESTSKSQLNRAKAKLRQQLIKKI